MCKVAGPHNRPCSTAAAAAAAAAAIGLASRRPPHLLPALPAPFTDLYALLKTTEKLERAFVRDAIAPKDYTPACERLIGQYKTLWDSIRSSVRSSEAACAYCCAPMLAEACAVA